MASNIVQFYNRAPRIVNEIIDKTYFQLNLGEDPLARFFPLVDYATMKLLLLDIIRKPTVASIVTGADIPATKPITTIDERIFSRMGVGKKYEFDDKDMDAMREMDLYLSSQAGLGTAIVEQLKGYFWGLLADLPVAIRRKQYVIMMQLVTYGSSSYVDPLTNVPVTINYGDTDSTILLSALAGGNTWNNTTATGLFCLQNHANAYYRLFGKFPDAMMLRRDNYLQLQAQDYTKTAYVARNSINVDTTSINGVFVEEDALADLIKQRTKVKDVIIFDTQYYEENKNDPMNPTMGHYLPDNYYVFLDEGNYTIAGVASPEKNYQPGVFTMAKVVEDAPIKQVLLGYQRCIPVIKDSRKLASCKVA
jgi:hypothetical protein